MNDDIQKSIDAKLAKIDNLFKEKNFDLRNVNP
jgi:hypothetical protein